jgi:hypothetical protein
MITVETQHIPPPASTRPTAAAFSRARDVNWDDFAEAAFMALNRTPLTGEATSLCAHVADDIMAWERCSGTRKRGRRNNKLKAFRQAVASWARPGPILAAGSFDQ